MSGARHRRKGGEKAAPILSSPGLRAAKNSGSFIRRLVST